MDCPLNWAHQQDRKAEALVNHRKFADAIICHQKASEFLQEAMKMTQVKQALVSLQLQVNSHCRQQRILKEKWMRCEIEEEKRKQEQERVMQERQNHQMVKGDIPPKVEMKNNSEMVDSKKGTECLQSSSLVISAENFSVSSTSSCSDSASSKDEKSVIKELEGQVSDLQMQVLSLSQNLEDSNRENSRLKKALDNIRELVKFKFGYEIGDELFDFSPVKSQCAAESDMSNSDNNDAIKRNFTGFEQDLRGQDGAVTDISTDLEGDLDKDIPLPPLETPQFTYEDENSKNATSEQTLLF